MKRVGKLWFFIVALLIIAFTTVALTGITTTYGDNTTVYVKGGSDIRWGIDIRGGVEAIFSPAEEDPTESQMESAAEVMRQRLIAMNVTDYEVFVDTMADRIIVRFPWNSDEKDFDPATAVEELGDTAVLTFREAYEVDDEGLPTGVTAENIILQGSDVKAATAVYGSLDGTSAAEWYVSLELNASGKDAFATATTKLATTKGVISIWLDDYCFSAPTVQAAITDGKAVINGDFDPESATALANKINGGALPFSLDIDTYSVITPTLGEGAKNAMLLAGIIAFALIAVFMIAYYRVPGFVAVIALLGQVGGTIAALTGFLPAMNSFTLTVPGIAGIILAVGMGVDANVITAERIKEEIADGKSIDGAIQAGFSNAFSAILDGNVTTVIIALILMGTFGASGTFLSDLFKPLYFMFGSSAEGTIYSFGYTLMVGVILNLFFGTFISKIMLKSLSRFKFFRNPVLYGGKKA